MRKKRVIANWKLHGSLDFNENLLSEIIEKSENMKEIELAVCPPALYIDSVSKRLAGSQIKYGAQNISDKVTGAYTGEISAEMLTDFNCKYAIIGHSERRHKFKESQRLIAKKVALALEYGIRPIYCVGETESDHENGLTEQVISQQLDPVIAKITAEDLDDVIIAYEPVWAVGTGLAATANEAQAVHAFIREKLIQESPEMGKKVCILYGGSVKPHNAEKLFSQPDIDGGLIGGAALKADDFIAIAKAAVATS